MKNKLRSGFGRQQSQVDGGSLLVGAEHVSLYCFVKFFCNDVNDNGILGPQELGAQLPDSLIVSHPTRL